MTIALLVCDHVPEPFARDHGDYEHMFKELLKPVEPEVFHVVDGEFPLVGDFDGFIVTGSRHGVYEDIPWIHQLKAFTKEVSATEKKYVGICFGHQMIAEALGGKVEKTEYGYLIGIHQFDITSSQVWMPPHLDSFRTLMLCQDQVNLLPEGAEILAIHEHCPIGMYTIGDQFLGIQGHPEFTKAYNQAVFESRSEKMGQVKIAEAIASFRHDPDRDLLKHYMLNFLKRNESSCV